MSNSLPSKLPKTQVDRKHCIQILATDGSVIKRLLWLNRQANGIYWGWCTKGNEIFHYSYHEDGNIFLDVKGEVKQIGKSHKLSQFFEFHQFANMGISNLDSLPLTSYELKPTDAAVYLDMRNYSKGVNIDVCLPECYKLHLLNSLLAGQWGNSELYLSSNVDPWIVRAYRDQAELEDLPTRLLNSNS